MAACTNEQHRLRKGPQKSPAATKRPANTARGMGRDPHLIGLLLGLTRVRSEMRTCAHGEISRTSSRFPVRRCAANIRARDRSPQEKRTAERPTARRGTLLQARESASLRVVNRAKGKYEQYWRQTRRCLFPGGRAFASSVGSALSVPGHAGARRRSVELAPREYSGLKPQPKQAIQQTAKVRERQRHSGSGSRDVSSSAATQSGDWSYAWRAPLRELPDSLRFAPSEEVGEKPQANGGRGG